jgi:hypothetical protein
MFDQPKTKRTKGRRYGGVSKLILMWRVHARYVFLHHLHGVSWKQEQLIPLRETCCDMQKRDNIGYRKREDRKKEAWRTSNWPRKAERGCEKIKAFGPGIMTP